MKQKLGGQQAQRQAEHSQHEIRNRLAQQDLADPHRSDEQRLERAALPFAGHHQRREHAPISVITITISPGTRK